MSFPVQSPCFPTSVPLSERFSLPEVTVSSADSLCVTYLSFRAPPPPRTKPVMVFVSQKLDIFSCSEPPKAHGSSPVTPTPHCTLVCGYLYAWRSVPCGREPCPVSLCSRHQHWASLPGTALPPCAGGLKDRNSGGAEVAERRGRLVPQPWHTDVLV